MNMKQKEVTGRQWKVAAEDDAAEWARPYIQAMVLPLPLSSSIDDPEKSRDLETMKESLITAYLSNNLNIGNIPLKQFMDGIEKNILLSCLRLTLGNQKHAAGILSLKPTALFEKMRKHGIRSQRGKLTGENWNLLADGDGH